MAFASILSEPSASKTKPSGLSHSQSCSCQTFTPLPLAPAILTTQFKLNVTADQVQKELAPVTISPFLERVLVLWKTTYWVQTPKHPTVNQPVTEFLTLWRLWRGTVRHIWLTRLAWQFYSFFINPAIVGLWVHFKWKTDQPPPVYIHSGDLYRNSHWQQLKQLNWKHNYLP